MATNGVAAPTSRAKEIIPGDEEVGKELRLGEFQESIALTISEANELVKALLKMRKDNGKFRVPDNEVVTKTQEYLELHSRFKERESIQAVETILQGQSSDLAGFERAQLGTLCCEEAEEAKTLVPSLEGKKTDEDLQELLDEITKLRQFV